MDGGEGGVWEAERGAERRALCVAIDEELRAFLRCVDNYQTANREVVSACKAGLFDMARARKSMGMGGCAVSQLQYPARMKASGVSWSVCLASDSTGRKLNPELRAQPAL